MAINSPHGEKTAQKPSESRDNETPENPEPVQNDPYEASLDASRRETISSLDSQENLTSTLSPLPSPSQRVSSSASSSQLDSPLSLPSLQPSLASSSLSIQSQPPSLSSPYQLNSISIEQLNELALQDSENNNVDENSNEGFNPYGDPPPQPVPDQSVRPRIRAQQHSGRDQPDRAPVEQRLIFRRRSSSSSHRRNLSEDLACSPTTNFPFSYEDNQHNPDFGHLPRLPNYQEQSNWSGGLQPLPQQEDTLLTRMLPLSLRGGGHGPPPSSIEQDTHDLLNNFTAETLQQNHLSNPESNVLVQGFRNPALYRVGQELRRLADTFAETEERKKVKRMAETVHLESINMENFFHLCQELFMGGITRERIVALFTFVGDIAVYHVRRQGHQFLQVLMRWSWRYLIDNVCRWVQEAGGWGVVLSRGANALYSAAVIVFCLIGTVAAGVYITKTVKDW